MRILAVALTLAISLPSAGSAVDAEGTIKARQSIMAYIGGNMRTLAGMARGSTDYNPEFVRAFGMSIAAMTAALPYLFPEGTGKEAGRTEADDAIFAHPGEFKAMIEEFGAAALSLSNSADAAELAMNLPTLTGSCSSCHSRFRSR